MRGKAFPLRGASLSITQTKKILTIAATPHSPRGYEQNLVKISSSHKAAQFFQIHPRADEQLHFSKIIRALPLKPRAILVAMLFSKSSRAWHRLLSWQAA